MRAFCSLAIFTAAQLFFATPCIGQDLSWTVHQLPGTTNNVTGVAYGSGRFVAIGADLTVYSSVDGINWTTGIITSAPGFSINPNADLTGVAYGNGWWVAIGAYVANEVMLRSSDGMNWTASDPDFTEPFDLTFSNGLFVAGDNDRGIYTSQDGTSWTRHNLGFTSSTGRPQTAVFGNGVWAVPNTGGVMFRSPDLVALQGPIFSTESSSSFTSVVHANGRFIAVDEYVNGRIRISADALTWTLVTGAFPTGHRGFGIAWGSSGYVICTSRSGFNSEGYILGSDDGEKWRVTTSIGIPMFSLCSGTGIYLAGASSGRVIRGVPTSARIRRQRDGNLRMAWPTQAGSTYDVQQSFSLPDWTNSGTVAATAAAVELERTPSSPRQFFRLRRSP